MNNILDSDLFEDKVPFYIQLSSVTVDGSEVAWNPSLDIGHGYIKFHSGLEVPFFFETHSGMACAGSDIRSSVTAMSLVLRECVGTNGDNLLGKVPSEALKRSARVTAAKDDGSIILGTDGVIHPPPDCPQEDTNRFLVKKVRVGATTFIPREDIQLEITDSVFSTKAFILNKGCPIKSITVPYTPDGARTAILRTLGSAILCSAIDFLIEGQNEREDKMKQDAMDEFNRWIVKIGTHIQDERTAHDFLTDVSFVLDSSAWAFSALQ